MEKFALIALALAGSLCCQALAEEDLPLPRQDPAHEPAPDGLLKPTKSIRPPATPVPLPEGIRMAGEDAQASREALILAQAAERARQRLEEERQAAALRRLVVVRGPVKEKPSQPEMLPADASGKNLTLVGIEASSESVRHIESFFGAKLTPDNQQKLLDAVSKGVAGAGKTGSKVEVLGWWPAQGVMAVAVAPES